MRKTDKPWKLGRQTKKRQMCAALLAVLLVSLAGCGKTKDGLTITNVSYDPESRGGNSPDGRKVKGTIHWVSA